MRTEQRDIAEYLATDGKASPGVDASKSKNELYEEARNAGIEGRSAMNKEQLIEALRQRQETSSPRGPATAETPAWRPRTRREPRSERQPTRSEVDSGEVVPPAAGARGPDRCAIAYKASGRYGEFNVIVTETDGSPRSVARSPAFRAPRLGRLRRRGQARVAHDLLVSRLEACEWWPVDSDGRWHEMRFVRLRGEGMRSRRSLVTVVREAGQARFAVEELDSYGKPTPFMLSTPFGAPRFGHVRPSVQAKAALKQLVKRMESEGWNAVTCVGKDWYAISFSRPVSTNRRSLAPASRAGRRAAEPA
jgi:Rho termination factor, N-terminal domain